MLHLLPSLFLRPRLSVTDEFRLMKERAAELGQVGMFVTLNAPSRFDKTSPWFDGSTPAENHAFMRSLWLRIRHDLQRKGISLSGMHLVEPRRDGTPHWHVISWMSPEQVATVLAVMRAHVRMVCRDDRCMTVQATEAYELERAALRYAQARAVDNGFMTEWAQRWKVRLGLVFGVLSGRVA